MNERDEDEDVVAQDAEGDAPPPARGTDAPLLVGVGLSAANVEPLLRFLAALTRPAPFAFVVVAQQREALDEARVTEAARAVEGLTVEPVRDGEAVRPGCLYLAPPDLILTVGGDRLHVRSAREPPGERATIDSFFLSMATAFRERAIGIVMGGTGGDGALGVTAVREHGGLTVAESEGVEGVPPNSTHAAALADFLLAPDRMPERLAFHARHVETMGDTERLRGRHPETVAALGRIAATLRNKTGHDFHGYKPNTFLRRVQRRMQVLGSDTIESYVEALRTDAAEPQNLFNDLLIGVTQFFRDPKEFELLNATVVPRLFEGKGAGDQVRVWVLGCATGEEAYSIAILLREHMATLDAVPQVQVFATDIDGRALAAARVGRYARTIARDVSPERLGRWFVREGDTYAVVKEVREMCIFSGHNIIRDAPFSRLDLVSCRNLLIYLNGDLQARIIPLFHFALRPEGFLFLGNAENVTRHAKLFAPVDRRARVFRRVESPTRILPDFPIATAVARVGTPDRPPVGRSAPVARLTRRAEHVAESHAPAYVIIDDRFDVLHFSGRTGRYLDPPGGAASLNVLNLVHRDLRLDLRAALQKAVDGRNPVRSDPVLMGVDGGRVVVDLVVETVREADDGPRNFVVLFKNGTKVSDEGNEGASAALSARDEVVRRLEGELRGSRDQLQATIEELESTNEELKSSNEEYQSLNEELQSANEELETSKEELQSVNEELTTVNGELAQRVHELARANSDLKNLLESTQIATVFLDNDLRVVKYTPAVTEVFPLIDTDVGRPISDIKASLPLDELQDDARRVLRTLGSVEREIDLPDSGSRYIVRVLPYRSVDNFIAGVVATFVDVTALTRAERAFDESEKRFRDLAEFSPEGILISADARFVYANRAAVTLLGAGAADEVLGLSPAELIHPDHRRDALDRLAEIERGATGSPAEFGFRRVDGSYVTVEVSAGPVTWEGRPAAQLLLRDVGARKQAEKRQALLLSELQHRVRNTIAVLRSIARRTAESSDTVEDYGAHLDGRINAFARVQSAVTRDPGAGVDLEGMVADELLAYQAKGDDQVRIEGPRVRFQPKAAETFGLAIHELATNAIKHGALSDPAGRVAIAWRVDGGPVPALRFDWVESDGPRGAVTPARRGFGTELLESTLAYEMKARTTLDFTSGHLRCRIELPLDGRTTVKPAPDQG